MSRLDLENNTSNLSMIEAESRKQILEIMSEGIGEKDLNTARRSIVKNPMPLSLPSELYLEIAQSRLEASVAELISVSLLSNK